MIEWASSGLINIFEAAFLLAVMIAFFKKVVKKNINTVIITSSLLALFFAYLINLRVIRLAFDTKLQEGIFSLFASISTIILLTIVVISYKKYKNKSQTKYGKLFSFIFFFSTFLVFIPRMIKFTKIFDRLILRFDMFNSSVLAEGTGFILSIIIAVLLIVSVIRNQKIISVRALTIFAMLSFVPGLIIYSTNALQMLVLAQVLPVGPALFDALITLINSQKYLNSSVLVLALAYVLLAYFGKEKTKLNIETLNSAQARKLKAIARGETRWIIFLFLMTAISYSVLIGGTVAAQKSKAAISKPLKTEINEKKVTISTDKFKDGKLHRFVANVQGVNVVFLIINKGSNIFGVALDACEICGPVGFYQEEENVICIACESVINKASVGFRGGCNPIPLKHKIVDKNIVIEEKDLIKSVKWFK